MKQLLSTLLIAALLLTCIPTALAAHTYDKSCLRYDEAFAFLTLLNQKRTSMGLGALSMVRELLDGASIRAYEQTISFSHTRPDGSKYSTAAPQKAHAECLHWSQPAENSTPQSALYSYMSSPPHKAILLNQQYHAAGVGVYEEGDCKYWAVVLSMYGATDSVSPAEMMPKKTVCSFADVYETDYYADAVLWAARRGITNGTSRTTFSPNQTCTRAQIVTFLWRAAGCPVAKPGENPFQDVRIGSYYYNAVLWAVENKITAGTGIHTFSPEQMCSRADAATFLWRALGSRAALQPVNSFQDIPRGSYYESAVDWLVGFGIVNGTGGGCFSPYSACTRGEVVTMLYRADAKHLPWRTAAGDAA